MDRVRQVTKTSREGSLPDAGHTTGSEGWVTITSHLDLTRAALVRLRGTVWQRPCIFYDDSRILTRPFISVSD